MKIGNSLVDCDVIFPMQSLEFTKLLDFGSNLKGKCKKKDLNPIDLNQIFPMKPS